MTSQPAKKDACTATREADRIQRFFARPVYLSLTIGIPFCIFKLLFGLVAYRLGTQDNPLLAAFGGIVVVWATADLLMNIGRSILDITHREPFFEYCTIAQLGRIFQRPLVFLAGDTLITFTIICAMLWLGWITRLDRPELVLWYTATTLNLISLSLVVLYNEIRNNV
ncbi:MAG: hypothetical protein M0Q92_03850 [Methanoregula sp.]|jgi:hypothetical protein|nr:hypothetical protein [Methanoregula sp.]